MKKKLFETDKHYKDTQKTKLQYEQDCRNLQNEFDKEQRDKYENTMTMDKSEKFGALGKDRHELETKLLKQFEEAKKQEQGGIKEARTKTQSDFSSMNDL